MSEINHPSSVCDTAVLALDTLEQKFAESALVAEDRKPQWHYASALLQGEGVFSSPLELSQRLDVLHVNAILEMAGCSGQFDYLGIGEAKFTCPLSQCVELTAVPVEIK